ncbi:MAG: glycosyltransferase family 25 protein [Rhodobacteraceae bacterium]|nr:glycosyltransferase family 25 protein [Paracoccaceae bacterium]
MKIYYINLESSVERRQCMESQLTGLELNYERVAAVDGKSLSIQQIRRYRQRTPSAPHLSNGAVACFLSHLKVWKMIAKKTDQFSVVMEDDIYISTHSRKLLETSSWIPVETPLIKLETTFAKAFFGQEIRMSPIGGYRFILRNCTIPWQNGYETGSGSACYIIHKNFAEWLTQFFKRFSWHVDVEFVRAEIFGVHSSNPVKGYPLQLFPAIAVQQSLATQVKNRHFDYTVLLSPEGYSGTISHHPPRTNPNIWAKVVREVTRVITVSQYVRQYRQLRRKIFGRRVPFIGK